MGRRGERCNCGKKMTDWEIKGVDMLYVGRFVSATKKSPWNWNQEKVYICILTITCCLCWEIQTCIKKGNDQRPIPHRPFSPKHLTLPSYLDDSSWTAAWFILHSQCLFLFNVPRRLSIFTLFVFGFGRKLFTLTLFFLFFRLKLKGLKERK